MFNMDWHEQPLAMHCMSNTDMIAYDPFYQFQESTRAKLHTAHHSNWVGTWPAEFTRRPNHLLGVQVAPVGGVLKLFFDGGVPLALQNPTPLLGFFRPPKTANLTVFSQF
jgi:hypothetical protein